MYNQFFVTKTSFVLLVSVLRKTIIKPERIFKRTCLQSFFEADIEHLQNHKRKLIHRFKIKLIQINLTCIFTKEIIKLFMNSTQIYSHIFRVKGSVKMSTFLNRFNTDLFHVCVVCNPANQVSDILK